MIFIPSKNIWTPSFKFGQPKFQKGILHPIGFWAPAGASGPTVSASSVDVSWSSTAGTVFAQVQYNSNGNEYSNSAPTSDNWNTSRGAWLDSGNAEDVWLERSLTGDTLFTDPGTGRHQLNTIRIFRLADSDAGPVKKETDLTVSFYDAASGGNLLDSVSYTLTAHYEPDF